MTFEEELIELLIDQGTTISFHPVKEGPWVSNIQDKDLYQVSLFGWHFEEFETLEGAEKCRLTLKDFAKKQMLNILLNKRINNKIQEEHKNHETTIATDRQKFLLKEKKIKEAVKTIFSDIEEHEYQDRGYDYNVCHSCGWNSKDNEWDSSHLEGCKKRKALDILEEFIDE